MCGGLERQFVDIVHSIVLCVVPKFPPSYFPRVAITDGPLLNLSLWILHEKFLFTVADVNGSLMPWSSRAFCTHHIISAKNRELSLVAGAI